MTDSKFGDPSLFPVGTRVRVNTRCEDFYFFNKTETGIVIRNSGKYLGIIVAFDEPRYFEGDYIQYTFGFHACSLEIIEYTSNMLKLSAEFKRKEVEPDGCEHTYNKDYCILGCKRKYLAPKEKLELLVGKLGAISNDYLIYPAAVIGFNAETDYEQRDGFKNGWNASQSAFSESIENILEEVTGEFVDTYKCQQCEGKGFLSHDKYYEIYGD